MDATSKPKFPSYAYSAVNPGPRNSWRAGAIGRLPWLGFGALLLALIGTASSVVILMVSNGQALSTWTWQPTVYLAIASAITNVALRVALTEGLNVAWWRRATKENTKIADLHRCWSHGNSVFAAITSGRQVSRVAIAGMLVAICPITGPLLQRASDVTIGQFHRVTNMNLTIASALPYGYTSYVSGRQFEVGLLTVPFAKVVNAAKSQADIHVTSNGCRGECKTVVHGAGFAINCSVGTVPFNLTPPDPLEFPLPYAQIFSSDVGWNGSGRQDSGTINLEVQYKDTHKCDGSLQIRNCTMKHATVGYPVIIDGNQSTIKLDPATTMFDDTDLEVIDIDYSGGYRSTFGGFYTALHEEYVSSVSMEWSGAVGYTLSSDGATANRYAFPNPDEDPDNASTNCTLAFQDPSQDMIQAVRDMMFRTAIAAANGSESQSIIAQQTSTAPIYKSSYLYLGLATLFTALAWLATLLIYISWWHMGRRTTMSPIEIAKAFNAPVLENKDSNATVDDLLEEIGDRTIRYGATAVAGNQLDRLAMGDPRSIRTPRNDQRFIG